MLSTNSSQTKKEQSFPLCGPHIVGNISDLGYGIYTYKNIVNDSHPLSVWGKEKTKSSIFANVPRT